MCGLEKDLYEFNNHKFGSFKKQGHCRECGKQYNQDHKEEIKKRKKVYHIKHKSENLQHHMWKGAKASAKQRGWEFTISENDVPIPEKCPVLGIPLFFTPGKRTDHSPSIDRIDSKKGYTKENTIVVSWHANRIKNDTTLENLEKVLNFYKGLTSIASNEERE